MRLWVDNARRRFPHCEYSRNESGLQIRTIFPRNEADRSGDCQQENVLGVRPSPPARPHTRPPAGRVDDPLQTRWDGDDNPSGLRMLRLTAVREGLVQNPLRSRSRHETARPHLTQKCKSEVHLAEVHQREQRPSGLFGCLILPGALHELQRLHRGVEAEPILCSFFSFSSALTVESQSLPFLLPTPQPDSSSDSEPCSGTGTAVSRTLENVQPPI